MFADRVIKHFESDHRYDGVLSDIRQATVIRADNVAKYLFEESSQENWNLRDDFPNIAPPFDTMFIEWTTPQFSRSGDQIIKFHEYGPKWVKTMGVIIAASEVPELPGIEKRYQRIQSGLNSSNPDIKFLSNIIMMKLNGAKWTCKCMEFLEANDGEIIAEPYQLNWGVSKDGQYVSSSGLVNEVMILQVAPSSVPNKDMSGLVGILYVPLLTLSFMHCKNVVMTSINPNKAKAMNRPSYHPLLSYKVLEIEPMKRILRHEGDSVHTGIQLALHICRGHFKDFSLGSGLFGKHKGMYWWSQQLRGSVDAGIAMKDYDVDSKNNE